MKKESKTIKGVEDIVKAAKGIKAESITVSKRMLKKFLTKQAFKVVTTPSYNTAVDRYVKDKSSTMGWQRKAFLVEYMNLKFQTKPGAKEIKEMCRLINKCVKNGDIFDCSLMSPHIMPFPQGSLNGSKPVKKKDQVWCLMYFGLSKISIEELRQKYGEIFVYEGSLPELFYPELKKKLNKDFRKPKFKQLVIDESKL